ncbi:hypothetical protein Efla_000219 [Eimeria flavescens]
MAAPAGVAVGCLAYAKMILHGIKHPQDAVCGLLIGSQDSGCCKRGEVLCADAVPLLHTHMLHPQLRLGVELVETLCEMPEPAEGSQSGVAKEAKKQKIVGFYYADLLTVPEKSPAINKEAAHIAKILQQHYPQLVVCTVRLQRRLWAVLIPQFWVASGSSWRRMPEESVRCSKAAIELAEVGVAKATYADLVDLDDHLAEPWLSPLNKSLMSGFAELIAEDTKCLDEMKAAS